MSPYFTATHDFAVELLCLYLSFCIVIIDERSANFSLFDGA
jgi:hypothetical protein